MQEITLYILQLRGEPAIILTLIKLLAVSLSVLCIPFTSNETFRFNERERWQLTLNALQVFKLLRTRFS